ncbi:hypothetical protein QBC36DRAFT_192385, partial [Triangularia setosa]
FGDLQARHEKHIEVKAEGLRDGVRLHQVFSATNLLEASKLTNRHIIIFTVVTTFYLPLGFVTVRLYNMSIIQHEALSHLKGPYVELMLSAACLTYMISIVVVFFVDWKKIIPWLL